MNDIHDEAWENEKVTISRTELAKLVGDRLDLEDKLMDAKLDDRVLRFCLSGLIKEFALSLCTLIFKDTTIEELEEALLADTSNEEHEELEIEEDENPES